MSVCAFCGHPDHRHRIVDAIDERIAAGDRTVDVLNDYGLRPSEFLRLADEVRQAESVAKRMALEG